MRKWTRYGRNQEFKAYFSILVHRTYYCVAIMLTDFYNKELLIFFLEKEEYTIIILLEMHRYLPKWKE